jgi:hypothetical protein
MRLCVAVISLALAPNIASAVLPPDLLFSIGSQFAAIIGALGVIIAGIIGAAISSARESVVWLALHRKIAITGALMLVFALITTVFIWMRDEQTPPVTPNAGGEIGEYRYFSDRFVVSGDAPDGRPFLFDVSLNRKGIPEGGFIHYYLVSALDGDRRTKTGAQEDKEYHTVDPQLFLQGFSRSVAADRSTRESYKFTLPLFDEKYIFSTGEFIGDFIEKNEPEYTLYISIATATVSRGKETFAARVMHERVYSSDFRPTIFFAGEESLSSESIQLILWDKDGNFYLIDRSLVETPSPAYTSHFWALLKKADGFGKKAFFGEATFKKTGATTFHSEVPDFFGASLELSLLHEFEENSDEGYVTGKVTDERGTRTLSGEGYRHIYGPESN